MNRTKPSVYLVAETSINESGLRKYLTEIGAPEWRTDAPSAGERLIEVMARMCYRAFGAGLNANLTKVREGNAAYLKNIIESGHGSVCEHSTVSFIFHNVSRVFTHELVRHRAGCAMSQESLRFVRLTDLGLWIPSCINDDPEMVALFEKTFKDLEELQKYMAIAFELDSIPFAKKKEITSAMRRIAPIGLSTSIGFTMNHRALRHILAMRTSLHAEEEIRLVFAEVGKICKQRWPNLYADFEIYCGEDEIEKFSTPCNKI